MKGICTKGQGYILDILETDEGQNFGNLYGNWCTLQEMKLSLRQLDQPYSTFLVVGSHFTFETLGLGTMLLVQNEYKSHSGFLLLWGTWLYSYYTTLREGCGLKHNNSFFIDWVNVNLKYLAFDSGSVLPLHYVVCPYGKFSHPCRLI